MSAPVYDSRMAKGEAIAKVESNVRRLDQSAYMVRSQSGQGEYEVLSTELGWTCACPDYRYRQMKCKHIIAVELSLQVRRRIENARRIVPLDYQSCLICGSEDIVKDGVRHNRNGGIQRFTCRGCGRRFVMNDGFKRMGATPQAITGALQLYFSGESLRSTQKFLRLQGVNVSHMAVYGWVRKYVGVMEGYLDKLTPQLGDAWRTDELFLKVRGNMKYLFAMMDDDTRFWIAQQIADTKGTSDVRPMFREAEERAGKKPKVLISDGAFNFGVASVKEWYSQKEGKVEHIRDIRLDGTVHNNKMERLNGEIRDREKVMRGVKKADSPILKGYQLYHNYLRPHEGLNGETPADRAGIKVEGENKWLTIIQNARRIKMDTKGEAHA